MITPTYVAANVMAGTKGKPYGAAALKNARIESIDSGRAAQNIANWRKYLPEDCVNAMVKAGWQSVV